MDGPDLRRAFTLASAFKEGDLAVGATRDDQLREDARRALLGASIGDIRRTAFVDDGVSAALEKSRDRRFDADLDAVTVLRARDILLAPGAAAWARRHRDALGSEFIAAIAKIMTGEELSTVARAIFNPVPDAGAASRAPAYPGDVVIGGPGHFGSRIQPNSPGDDLEEILFSTLEGLSYGCGDVILGLNPASDDLETIVRLEQLLERVVRRLDLPTRFCVLSDIVKQYAARAHANVAVGFQSLAGTSRALAGMVGLDVDGLADLASAFDGLYFETGQGSEVTNGAAEGIDMVTLESRTYGVARHLGRRRGRPSPWLIVNDVAGFIGPEVFRSAEQLERACLEDVVMAKLHGLTMGLDVCATFHMGISPAALRGVTQRIVERGAPAYLMAVAGNADPMLGYLTTAFREHPRLRTSTGRTLASPMQRRLAALGVLDPNGSPKPGPDRIASLYAAYSRAGGDRRTAAVLAAEGRRRLQELRALGFDLGAGDGLDADSRVETIYANARAALYSRIDDAVVHDACPRHLRVRTAAGDRDDYLAHPASGERLAPEDTVRIAALRPLRQPQVQIIVSDGLNANAINGQLRALLPPLRQALAGAGCHVGDIDVVVRNGRVRVGYEIGGLIGAAIVIHIIGERPGTGLDTASAYLTWGRDAMGQPRWSRGLDHAATTAICGIHPRGKPPEIAAGDIARTVWRIAEQRRSGVALRAT